MLFFLMRGGLKVFYDETADMMANAPWPRPHGDGDAAEAEAGRCALLGGAELQ